MRSGSKYRHHKERAILLRRAGKTYAEIQEVLNSNIPPSTLSTWFQSTIFSPQEKNEIEINVKNRIRNGHLKALASKLAFKEKRFQNIRDHLAPLVNELDRPSTAKIVLIMLYWCEGSKHRNMTFGNSDPQIIGLFLDLMRKCYVIDESKFRCTLQCRADQDTPALETFWSDVTGIPLKQFYQAKIDKRTVGKPSKKLSYKGVCRIDYFSSVIYHELVTAKDLF